MTRSALTRSSTKAFSPLDAWEGEFNAYQQSSDRDRGYSDVILIGEPGIEMNLAMPTRGVISNPLSPHHRSRRGDGSNTPEGVLSSLAW